MNQMWKVKSKSLETIGTVTHTHTHTHTSTIRRYKNLCRYKILKTLIKTKTVPRNTHLVITIMSIYLM